MMLSLVISLVRLSDTVVSIEDRRLGAMSGKKEVKMQIGELYICKVDQACIYTNSLGS